MSDGIQFQNIYHKSTLSNSFSDQVGCGDDDSCASDDN